jgi:hypothetical protein
MRTKQTARKATGRLPKAKDSTPVHLQDHAGRPYTVVDGHRDSSPGIFKLGIQLYCLGNPKPSPAVLGDKFLSCKAISGWGNARNWWPRVDVHTDFDSVEECVEHHRREKAFRKAAVEEMRRNVVEGLSEEAAYEKLKSEVRGSEPLPHIVPSWCPSAKFWNDCNFGSRYRSWVLIMLKGCTSWDDVIENGLLHVSFDLDITPAMETKTLDLDMEEDTLLEGDEQGWVEVEKTGIEKSDPVDCRLLCVREQPADVFLRPEDVENLDRINEVFHGWKTPGHYSTLDRAWRDATSNLRDCTYRKAVCDACMEDEDHTACEMELDEHYFDDDGQCTACRRATEYRRRSKRIATGDQKRRRYI